MIRARADASRENRSGFRDGNAGKKEKWITWMRCVPRHLHSEKREIMSDSVAKAPTSSAIEGRWEAT